PEVTKAAGFHLSGLNSPWLSWAQIAERKVAAKDDAAMKVYVNTIEARTWTEAGEAPDWQGLYDRREDYRIGTVPMGGLFLTAGVDVQKDRLEVEVVAWGRDRECWSVDYRVLSGDPVKQDVWLALDALLAESFTHASQVNMAIVKMAIDTGYATQEVYDWVRRQSSDRVIAVKGTDRLGAIVGAPSHMDVMKNGKRKRRGLLVWPVGSSFGKSELYGCLRKDRPTDEQRAEGEGFPAGYCHFPKHGQEYFKQLTSERLVTVKDKRGFPRREWHKLRERNEALDCRVYAWRKVGVNACISMDGEAYIDPNFGLTSACTSLKLQMNMMHVVRCVDSLVELIGNDAQFKEPLLNAGVKDPRFSFEIMKNGLLVYEAESCIAFNLSVKEFFLLFEYLFPTWAVREYMKHHDAL
ncbi:MAG: phage terminase large subunit family protein, partial [Alphaproteobacteria bacterium]|nr:phage terminase large subunit family protein [Alphaproteobacteria bacterium]